MVALIWGSAATGMVTGISLIYFDSSGDCSRIKRVIRRISLFHCISFFIFPGTGEEFFKSRVLLPYQYDVLFDFLSPPFAKTIRFLYLPSHCINRTSYTRVIFYRIPYRPGSYYSSFFITVRIILNRPFGFI
jgi:hypothetical protein